MNHAKTITLIGDEDGCALHRCLLPITELQRQGYKAIDWDFMSTEKALVPIDLPNVSTGMAIIRDELLVNIVRQYDAIILPRRHWPASENWKADRWFDTLHRAGLAVIYELDDDLFSDDFERRLVVLHGYTATYAREHRGFIIDTIRRCDGVTVSSQRVATMLRQYVDIPIRVVPNYIDLRWFQKIQKKAVRKVEGLTIGWAGGNRPDSDVEMMARAWKEIARKYPHVTFVIQGHHAKTFYEHVPNERIAMLDWMPIDSYPAGMKNIDIGCCPLGNTQFNRAKTYIKALEYAATGAAVVASPTVYGQIIEHGVDGYISETVDEWVEYLSILVEDYGQRKAISKKLLAKVRREHTLEQNAWRWVEAWTDLVTAHRAREAAPHVLLPDGVKVNYEYA